MKYLISSISCFLIFGCVSTSGVFNTGPDSYVVTATSDTTSTGPSKKVYEEATQKCMELNKSFLQTNFFDETTSGYSGITIHKVRLEFRCLNADHPAFLRADERRESDRVIEIRK